MAEQPEKKKLESYRFWDKVLGKPKLIVAPMVDASELAWRMLSRKYGAELCYTPMLHSAVFCKDPQYRKDGLASCDADRPLIVQFCGNNPEYILKASLLAQDFCDAVDLNLGCPQAIAKKGNYGAYLGENWELVKKIVKACHEHLSIPITCKIRVFDDIEKTVTYAKMLESAGCQLLTVHGRTKEMKGPKTGIASWKHIKAVKEAVSIPVFANGNIQYKEDVERCLSETGVDGVMTAEGNLYNPAIFTGARPVSWEISREYLDLAEAHPCPASYARGHVFKMCHHALQRHTEARDAMATSKTLGDMRRAMDLLRDVCVTTCQGRDQDENLPFPHWFCQPYVRPAPKPDPPRNKTAPAEVQPGEAVSKRRLKKLVKRCRDVCDMSELNSLEPNEKATRLAEALAKKQANRPVYEKCVACGNPSGTRCVFLSCRRCCKARALELRRFCQAHRHFTPKEAVANKG